MIIIEQSTVRDVTYVTANMRPADKAELRCQIHPNLDPAMIASEIALASQLSWTVLRNGQPIACFGAMPSTYTVWQLWAFGTKHLWRAIPAISHHMFAYGAQLMELGARRLEVRAWKGHDLAPLWLKAVGCTYVADLPDHGIAGEVFELWEWTASDFLDGSMQARRRERSHVLHESPKATAAAQAHPAPLQS